MIKKSSKIISFVILTVMIFTLNVTCINAEPPGAPPGGNSNGGGAPLGTNSASNVSYTGNTVVSESKQETGTSYSSTNSAENALLVSGGESTITNISVTKLGDTSDENSDFYGTNAAVLVYNNAKLNIDGGTIETNGSHANGVFSYGSGVITIKNAIIKTTKNNSGAIMVTGGGTLTAENVTAETSGNSSAPIRSDRGGGTLTVNYGTYTANGVGSPAIYSTADIIVNNATLISNVSEGAIVEGKNSITLNNTTLTDTNTTLNGNSETYKNIFLYQSMSGDADEGTAKFNSTNSKIITNKGDTIFVTNTKAEISLTNNTITNNDENGALLRIQSGKWGNSGSNGGTVTLNMSNQNVNGDIYVDNISTLDISLKEGSKLSGIINKDNTAKTVNITLDKNSSLILTGDSYITSLTNEDENNGNINLNGHTLFVGSEKITSTSYVENTDTTSNENVEENNTNNEENILVSPNESSSNKIIIIICVTVACVLLVGIIILVITKSNKKGKNNKNKKESENDINK